MGEFFGSIYCWFEEFFGLDLANYLWGESAPQQNKHCPRIYNSILRKSLTFPPSQ